MAAPNRTHTLRVNSTAQTPSAKFVHALLKVLDDGPVKYDPHSAMVIAVATPLALLALVLFVMLCRGVPVTYCNGRCTYWRRMPRLPRGTEPDQAIGEHQDENCDVDSEDEQPREPDPDLHEADIIDDKAHAACCSKMAHAVENGALNGRSSRPDSAQAHV